MSVLSVITQAGVEIAKNPYEVAQLGQAAQQIALIVSIGVIVLFIVVALVTILLAIIIPKNKVHKKNSKCGSKGKAQGGG